LKKKTKKKPIAQINFFYCGTGDTILIKIPDDDGCPQWGLIDCNLTKKSGAYYRVRQHIKDHDIRKLKFVCLSHPHQDHFRGMKKLLTDCFYEKRKKELYVDEFWNCGADYQLLFALARRMDGTRFGKITSKDIYSLYNFLYHHTLDDRKPNSHRLKQEGVLCVTDMGQFYFVCIAPCTDRVDRFNLMELDTILTTKDFDDLKFQKEDKNDLSVILLLLHKELSISVAFGGDASTVTWNEALPTWRELGKKLWAKRLLFDVIKVSHHGSVTSRCGSLYRDFSDKGKTVAILSVGPDDNNHPHPDILKQLRRHGILEYATCRRREKGTSLKRGSPCGKSTKTFRGKPSIIGHEWADLEVTIYDDGSFMVDKIT